MSTNIYAQGFLGRGTPCDDILPSQLARSPQLSGEKVLMLAILDSARCDLKSKLKHRWIAERWINGYPGALFSFEFCCDALGLEVESARQRLLDGASRPRIRRTRVNSVNRRAMVLHARDKKVHVMKGRNENDRNLSAAVAAGNHRNLLANI